MFMQWSLLLSWTPMNLCMPIKNNVMASGNYSSRSYPTLPKSLQSTYNSRRRVHAEKHMHVHIGIPRKQCFFCDEPYSVGHKCVWRGAAKVLVLDGYAQQDSEELCILIDLPSLTMEEQSDDKLTMALENPFITLNVLTDEQKPNTMQIQGSVGTN